jgi:hypothetical protein
VLEKGPREFKRKLKSRFKTKILNHIYDLLESDESLDKNKDLFRLCCYLILGEFEKIAEDKEIEAKLLVYLISEFNPSLRV